MNAMVGISMKASATEVAKLWKLVFENSLKTTATAEQSIMKKTYAFFIIRFFHFPCTSCNFVALLNECVCAFGSKFSFKNAHTNKLEFIESRATAINLEMML